MKETKTCLTLLCERIENEFEGYVEEIEDLEVDLYGLFREEALAYDEVRRHITQDDILTDGDAAYLLTFDKPLKALARAWEKYKAAHEKDFERFIHKFITRSDIYDESLNDLVDDLADKYGEETPLETACLVELVEMGKRLFRLLEAEHLDSVVRHKRLDDLEFDADFDDGEMEVFEVDCTDEEDSDDSKDSEGGDV